MINKYIILFLFLLPVLGMAQSNNVTLSGVIKDTGEKKAIPFVNIKIKQDSNMVSGVLTDAEGRFVITDLVPGQYRFEISYMGFEPLIKEVSTGKLNSFLDLGTIFLKESIQTLSEINIKSLAVTGVNEKMDKKNYVLENNISQAGGSVMQAMQNLPGITMQDGKIMLRGNDKVAVLIDGRQNAMTGFGNQSGLDNIPASAIERIEIINNPSAKYDANGNAGIINIIYKKNKQEGFNGKIGIATGLGAIWDKATPKINPSLSLNYRKHKMNVFFQGDWLYTKTLNRNETAERIYEDGELIHQKVTRNRKTTFAAVKTGMDWNIDESNQLTISGLFNREKIIDHGDIPYYNADFSLRSRLWQFLEDEVKYTATASAVYQHQFKQPGHVLHANLNYTFHREDEKYFFTNILPSSFGTDAFKLLSDEHVADLNIDYVKPLRYGRIEGGLKFRRRNIPTNMVFLPGQNSVIDVNAGGEATYSETIPALYGNYVFEHKRFEMEVGLRLEYVKVQYKVNPGHNTYSSDGYDYTRPFPTVRLAYKLDERNKISLFYNGRVDRPNEVDIRIFPKYDEPEVLKVGNPTLRPQFTNTLELGHKMTWDKGSLFTAAYHKNIDATITRIATIVPGNTLIYAVFQNAGKSYNTGIEMTFEEKPLPWFSFNLNGAFYRNTIDAFSVENRYPVPTIYTASKEKITSWNAKFNGMFRLPKKTDFQFSATYLAPDLIPQGKIGARFSVDIGLKKQIQGGKGELFFNGTDILNTLRIKKSIQGNGFVLNSSDHYETQVFRIGYGYKF